MVAWVRSELISTPVMVRKPMRGSFSSSRMNWLARRSISAATRCWRRSLMVCPPTGYDEPPPKRGRPTGVNLGDAMLAEDFEDIAIFDIVEALDDDTALVPRQHLT